MMKFEFPSIERAAGRVATRSALNPLLWLTAIFTSLSFTTGVYVGGPAVYFFGILGAIPLIAVIYYFDYFARREPNRLQSEDYQIQTQHMQMYGQRLIESGRVVDLPPPSDSGSVLGSDALKLNSLEHHSISASQ